MEVTEDMFLGLAHGKMWTVALSGSSEDCKVIIILNLSSIVTSEISDKRCQSKSRDCLGQFQLGYCPILPTASIAMRLLKSQHAGSASYHVP